jgi:hypothetical protein
LRHEKVPDPPPASAVDPMDKTILALAAAAFIFVRYVCR